jgi:hypothetical protein
MVRWQQGNRRSLNSEGEFADWSDVVLPQAGHVSTSRGWAKLGTSISHTLAQVGLRPVECAFRLLANAFYLLTFSC